MGQNKRYPGHTIENEVNQLDTRPKPVELTAEELDFANHPVTTPANPIVVQPYSQQLPARPVWAARGASLWMQMREECCPTDSGISRQIA